LELGFVSWPELNALAQVVFVDLVLAGDNAIVVGMVAAGLPEDQRRRVIAVGITAATVMRVMLAAITVQLLQVVGLLLAGGMLLLWVCWKLWRELRAAGLVPDGEEGAAAQAPQRKTVGQAAFQIVVADLSMSLDNVLAVAGVAREHTWVLVVGLTLSVVLMGVAAAWIARLLERHHWIAYVGLAVIFFVAARMVADGAMEVWFSS
jgi:YjbE family integral membrane protein